MGTPDPSKRPLKLLLTTNKVFPKPTRASRNIRARPTPGLSTGDYEEFNRDSARSFYKRLDYRTTMELVACRRRGIALDCKKKKKKERKEKRKKRRQPSYFSGYRINVDASSNALYIARACLRACVRVPPPLPPPSKPVSIDRSRRRNSRDTFRDSTIFYDEARRIVNDRSSTFN